MPNPHAEWRIELARRLAGRVARFEGVRAVVVGGSVARGYADQYSDLEIIVYRDATPPDATRLALVAALDADFLHAFDGPSREDQLLVNGFQVDLWHMALADAEATLDAVLVGHTLDFGHLHAMDTIRACLPLYGEELVARWKRRALEYPEELARRIVEEHVASFGVGELFVLSVRDNPTAFYAQLGHLQKEIFLVLLALNRRYFDTLKWLHPSLESMRLKPENVNSRFRDAFKATYAEALADTKRLLEETLRLVEAQFPEVDTTQASRRLDYVRAAHEPRDTFDVG